MIGRSERKSGESGERREREKEMGIVKGVEKVKSISRSKMKMWMIRATTSVLLWTCVVQLTTIGEMWGPRVLKGWPSCFSHEPAAALEEKVLAVPARVLPPKSESTILL